MKAIDRKDWPNFLRPSEFPNTDNGDSVLNFMDNEVIDALIDVRVIANVPIAVSSNWKAQVRFTGSETSQHYAVDRLSTAIDGHCLNNRDAYKIYEAAKQVPTIKGLGIYFDWKMGKVGFHFDIRKTPSRIQWVCPNQRKREYIYLHHSPAKFYSVVGEEFCKL